MRWHFLFLWLVAFDCSAQNAFPPIKMWREHLPYHSAIDVTASATKIYCATPFSLFTVTLSGNEINRISKVAGLSETGIRTLRYDAVSGKLLIAYSNSNMDLIDEKGIHNLPDLKRENSSGDKTVYDIFPDNHLWYLSTGLGVLVVDGEKMEIRDSWIIGQNGGSVRTNAFTRNNGFFYAATEEGLKKLPVTSTNPSDFSNWQTVSGTGGLPAGACRSVVGLGGRVIALVHDSLFAETAAGWALVFANAWPVISVRASENRLLVCQRQAGGASQVAVLDEQGVQQNLLRQPGVISFPQQAISVNGHYWTADLYGGLSQWTAGSFETYPMNSPEDIALGSMTVYRDTLYAAAGTVNSSWNYQYNRNGVYRFAAGHWTNYNQFAFPFLDSLMDMITVAVDHRDGSAWAGSFGGGLLHIQSDGQMEVFKQQSPLEQAVGDPGSYRVSGLAFDASNNLWIANFGAGHQLHVRKNDGTWKSFSVPFLVNDNAVSQILIDDINQKWIVSPMGNGLIVFNDNNSIDNNADDRWTILRPGAGHGNLPSSDVLCLARDKSGYIWVGTADGVAVIQCPEAQFSGGCDAVWPVIRQGNFASYLFKGQEVRCIAIDGADRKWMATASGAWLMNADGDSVIEHLTEDNSPLLSNDVRSLAIEGGTGEVFFATAKGICSFRGTATEAEETKSSVLVFPNPVPPSYNGQIGIRGLPENSLVKITETGGRLVYQTRSLGGQAVWNGRDYRGRPVSSGIYLVLAQDGMKQEKVVTKIVVIGQ